MPGYTPTGPWTNGAAPGISAAFLGNLENWIQQTEGDIGSVTVTGTTAGSATLYEFLQGPFKAVLIYYNGYRNSTATEQTITLPVAFTVRAVFVSGGIPPSHPLNGGSSVNCNIVTGLPTGTSAGATTTETAINGYSYGNIFGAWTAWGLGTSQASALTDVIFLIGI